MRKWASRSIFAPFEFATFYADVTRGAFQLYSLRWIGGNEQPDIFTHAFSTARFSPKGANRGHYSNPKLDALLDDASISTDQEKRRADYVEAQQILARDLPVVNLWYKDNDRSPQPAADRCEADRFGQLCIS